MRNADRRVLIIDADVDVAQLMARVARAAGCDARTVSGAGDFCRALSAFRPQLVVLDLQMPDTECARLLSAIAPLDRPPGVVLVSGLGKRALEATATTCRGLGLDYRGGLSKPFDVDDFRALLARTAAHAAA